MIKHSKLRPSPCWQFRGVLLSDSCIWGVMLSWLYFLFTFNFLFLSCATAHIFSRTLDLFRGRGIHQYFPCSPPTCSEVVRQRTLLHHRLLSVCIAVISPITVAPWEDWCCVKHLMTSHSSGQEIWSLLLRVLQRKKKSMHNISLNCQ